MINIGFAGDCCISGKYLDNFQTGIQIFSDEVIEDIESCDFVVVNFEGPETERYNHLRKEIRVANPIGAVEYLAARNIRIFNLANNHIFDCGAEGFLDTKQTIEKYSCDYFGAGENIQEASEIHYIEKDGIRIALIGIAQKEGMSAGNKKPGVFCEDDYAKFINRIKEAKKKSDWVILNYHGGEELSVYPSTLKRRILKKYAMVDGIDIVIAHHSHVLQGFEQINGKYIFYSLGNFILNVGLHNSFPETKTGGFLKISFSRTNFNIDLKMIESDHAKGIINFRTSDEYLKTICDFAKLKTKWLNESFKIIFMERDLEEIHHDNEYIGRDKRNLLSRIFYIATHKYLLSTYLNAYFAKFLKTVKLLD